MGNRPENILGAIFIKSPLSLLLGDLLGETIVQLIGTVECLTLYRL